MAAMERDDVFDAKIVSGLACSSSCLNTAPFTDNSSNTAYNNCYYNVITRIATAEQRYLNNHVTGFGYLSNICVVMYICTISNAIHNTNIWD